MSKCQRIFKVYPLKGRFAIKWISTNNRLTYDGKPVSYATEREAALLAEHLAIGDSRWIMDRGLYFSAFL